MKYCEPGGLYRMEIDMMVAGELQDQISEASDKSQGTKSGSKDANSKWEKRKQKRAKRNA